MTLLVAVIVLVGLFLVFACGAWRNSPREGKQEKKRRVTVAGHGEVPLSERTRTLKVCPDCRELVLLEAPICKFCGCALGVEPEPKPSDRER